MKNKKKWITVITWVMSIVMTVGIFASATSFKALNGDSAKGKPVVETSLETGDRDVPYYAGKKTHPHG